MTADGANLDASTFDLDSWIDDVVRPEVTVELYPYEYDFNAKIAAIEKQMPIAEAISDGDRGMDDATVEQLIAQVQELRAERSRTAVKVRVRQITKKEMTAAALAAKEADWPQDDWALWTIAASCVDEKWTPERLRRLRDRDLSGESMVAQLWGALDELMKGLPVPS